MTTYTVSTSPQAIYPDGHNDAFAITNNGPWTVLIDDNSSIGDGSYEVPPLASIPWNARRPLWIAAKPAPEVSFPETVPSYLNSTVRLTRQEDVIQPRGSATVLLMKASEGISQSDNFGVFETSTFESLIINVTEALKSPYGAVPTNFWNNINVVWYSSTGLQSRFESYTFPQLDTSLAVTQPARFVIPVLDAYCQILFDHNSALNTTGIAVQVYGVVNELPKSIQYWENVGNSDIAVPARNDEAATRYPNLKGPDLAVWDNWYTAGAANQIYVAPMTNHLTIAARAVGIVGGTTIVVEMVPFGLPAAGNFIAELALPAGASVIRQEIDLPFGSPIRIRTAYAGAGNMRLSLIWS